MSNNVDKDCKWMVVYCPSDDSHVLMPYHEVICEESVKVNDEVKFRYSGKRHLLSGTLKGMSEDRDAMIQLQEKLNSLTRPKREPSFHENLPRRLAVRCAERNAVFIKNKSRKLGAGNSSKQQTSKGKILAKPKVATKEAPPLQIKKILTDKIKAKDVYSSDSDSDTTSGGESTKKPSDTTDPEIDAVSSSSESESEDRTEEEVLLLQKISKKKRTKDLKSLLSLTASSKNPSKDCSGDDEVVAKKHKLNDGNGDTHSFGKAAACSMDDEFSTADATGGNFEANDVMESDFEFFHTTTKSSNTGKPNETQAHMKSKQPSKEIFAKPQMDQSPPTPSTSTVSHQEVKTGNTPLKSKSKENHSLRAREQENHSLRAKELSLRAKLKQLKKAKHSRVNITFNGEFFRYTEGVNLSPDFPEVFISISDMKAAKRCITASALVRCLVKNVFTDEALDQCSVSGKPSPNTDELRPALHQDGIMAILDFATKRANKKKWPKPNEIFLKGRMGNVLCEDRQKKKLLIELESMAQGNENEDSESD